MNIRWLDVYIVEGTLGYIVKTIVKTIVLKNLISIRESKFGSSRRRGAESIIKV